MVSPQKDESTTVVTQIDAELIAVEFEKVPFEVKRVFVVSSQGEMRNRGNHYAGCDQKIILLSGRVDLHLCKDGESRRDHHLSEVGCSILVQFDDFVTYELLDADSRILVLASESYEAIREKRFSDN